LAIYAHLLCGRLFRRGEPLQVKNRIRVLRAEKDWTQAQLAALIGVSRQAIVAVENGKYEPALPLAFRIARAFGKNIEEVFLWEERNDSASSPVSP
jgi:putative transcriptional regulator